MKAKFSDEAVGAHAPVVSQSFMLLERHREKLYHDTGGQSCVNSGQVLCVLIHQLFCQTWVPGG